MLILVGKQPAQPLLRSVENPLAVRGRDERPPTTQSLAQIFFPELIIRDAFGIVVLMMSRDECARLLSQKSLLGEDGRRKGQRGGKKGKTKQNFSIRNKKEFHTPLSLLCSLLKKHES